MKPKQKLQKFPLLQVLHQHLAFQRKEKIMAKVSFSTYLRDKVVVGIVLWNIFNRMPIARKVSTGLVC